MVDVVSLSLAASFASVLAFSLPLTSLCPGAYYRWIDAFFVVILFVALMHLSSHCCPRLSDRLLSLWIAA